MNYQTYHIPANFTDAGKLFGLFAIRNAIEALLIAVPPVFIVAATSSSTPTSSAKAGATR